MRKVLLSSIFTLISLISYAQNPPSLKLTPNGVEPIVVEIDSLKANEIYNKALNWIQETYKNPSEVLKANIPNDKIRIDGFANNAWYFKSLGAKQFLNMEYSVEISFKDGKYRFEYIIGQFWVNGGEKAFYDYKDFYKKTGEIKSMFSESVPALETTMNDLSQSFYNYVIGTKSKKKDW